MSASRLLRASPSALRSLGGAQRSLHTSATLLLRDARSNGPRSSLRGTTRSSSTKQVKTSASKPAKPTSNYAAPIHETSTSGTPRHHQAKVEVIPFRIPTASARDYLTTLATAEVMPRVMSRWSIIKHQLLSLIGVRSMSDTEGKIVKLKRMTALYLPIWIVDASFEIKCRGNDGRAEANFITTSSRFPGHSWKPMDSMPMFPPPPNDMIPKKDSEKDPSFAADAPKEAWNNLTMVDYASWESHLEQKAKSDIEIKGGIPEPVPFTISPLSLPNMLRKQLELKDAIFTPDLATNVRLPGVDTHGLGLTISLVNEEGEQLTSPPVRFEPDTLKLDMFAAYPILMPLHMAEFTYKEPEGERHTITMVLGAWDTNGVQFCFKEKDQDWRWSIAEAEPFQIDNLDLYPRAPIKTNMNEVFEREREKERTERRSQQSKLLDKAWQEEVRKGRKTRREVEAEYDRAIDEDRKGFQSELRSRMLEKLRSELPIQAAVQKRSLELLRRADWIHWERDEREAYETRTSFTDPSSYALTGIDKERYESTLTAARTAPTEPRPFQWLSSKEDRRAEREHPDRKAGLGRYIYLTSPHVQRLSHNVYANRRYLTEAIPKVLTSRKRMASIAEAGRDVDRSLISAQKEDGTKISGEEAFKTIASDDLSVRQQRQGLKPRWLKMLEEAGRRG